jgi:putative transposase
MTYSEDYSIPEEILEQICEEGIAIAFDALPDLVRIMINTAMKIERQKRLGAGPYERTPERQGYANGYKDKTVATRVGKITFDIPQVRESDFHPNSLEKGIRSERALERPLCASRDVCPGSLYSQGSRYHRADVWLCGVLSSVTLR